MKRIIRVFLVLLICLSVKNVYAANYSVKELIPLNVKTSIHTDNFSYKGMHCDGYGVYFTSIKNLTEDNMPISISIGLFDKDKKNIGTINYCNNTLQSKEEREFFIDVSSKYIGKGKKQKDVKYIAVLGDNTNCRIDGSTDYIGQRIDNLGVSSDGKLDSKTQLFLYIVIILVGAFVVLIVYKLLFTKSYRNVDGKEVRDAYDDINRELREMREEEEKNRVAPPPKEPDKPIEILEQEEEARNEDKSGTDLHNLYK